MSQIRISLVVAMLTLVSLGGCGDDNDRKTATPTPTATAIPTQTPTPTEAPHPPHSIMRVGSTQPEGGMLTVDSVPVAFVVPVACLGGVGPTCEGGVIVYGGDSPGFNNLNENNPSLPIYRLPDGVEVRMELTQADTDTSVLISGVTLDAAGQEALVNTTPELHNHPLWQFAAPATEHSPADRHLSFRLLADGFEPSDDIALTLRLFTGEGGGDHD